MKSPQISQLKGMEPTDTRKSTVVYLAVLYLVMALCTVMATAQESSQQAGIVEESAEPAASSPVAYVYVSSLIGNSGEKGEIFAYAAASTGKLTPITGSPLAANVDELAGNGAYLFASTLSGTDIDSFTIESNGSLRYATSTNVVSADGGCGNANTIFTDHTGSTLYDMAYFGNQCTNNTFETFKITESNGKLSFLGDAGANEQINGRVSFIGNDQFAYSSNCYHLEPAIFGFKRNSSGTLSELNINPRIPSAPGGNFFCPWLAAPDPTNHMAISLQAVNGNLDSVGATVLATYTASGSGSLTTSSTSANMPAISVGSVNAMNMSPSGALLAVAGSKGLQVFHFNGANPITHYTGQLTASPVDTVFWDNSNHLYAISSKANKLWVFTVTPSSYSQAPGSPYSVNAPQGLKVLPR